jgi:hypothetical protein
MLTAVKLDHRSQFGTIEIKDVPADRTLAPELLAGKSFGFAATARCGLLPESERASSAARTCEAVASFVALVEDTSAPLTQNKSTTTAASF